MARALLLASLIGASGVSGLASAGKHERMLKERVTVAGGNALTTQVLAPLIRLLPLPFPFPLSLRTLLLLFPHLPPVHPSRSPADEKFREQSASMFIVLGQVCFNSWAQGIENLSHVQIVLVWRVKMAHVSWTRKQRTSHNSTSRPRCVS